MSVTKGKLLDLLNEIYDDPSKWVYKNNKDELLHYDIFDKEKCRDFIEEYFDCTGKDADSNTLLRNSETNDEISSTRYQHIVITFFYGLLIYDKCTSLKSSIDKYLSQERYEKALKKHQDAPFAYVWFLICLFHDLAYPFEYKRENEREYKSFNELKEAKKWECDPDGVPSVYDRNLLSAYFDYRNKKNGTMDAMNDHGICAGYHLYADLCNIRDSKSKAATDDWWNEDLKIIFNLAAWVVACHNIWTIKEDADEDKLKAYRDAHLEKLILGKDEEGKIKRLIHPQEHPFLFLFCLVDSIEPVKVVKDVNLLDKILLEIADEGIKIDVQLTCGCHNKLLNSIRDLDNWLTKVSVTDDTGRICLHE